MTNSSSRAGFSLVEVALALMVVGVGMVAIFSVLPAGLDSNKKAIDDSQEALFAEEVFNGIRAKADQLPWASLATVTLDNVVPEMWKAGTPLKVTAGAGATNVYESVFVPVIDYAVRYQLTITDVAGQPNVKGIRLIVWNGQYGSPSNPDVYYTELRRTRP